VHPCAFLGGGRGVDDLLHVPRLDVLAGHAADHRDREPLAQPALGVRVLAGPPPVGGQAVGVGVVRDQVGAASAASRSVTFSSLAASRSPDTASHCRRLPFSYQTARHRSWPSRAG